MRVPCPLGYVYVHMPQIMESCVACVHTYRRRWVDEVPQVGIYVDHLQRESASQSI